MKNFIETDTPASMAGSGVANVAHAAQRPVSVTLKDVFSARKNQALNHALQLANAVEAIPGAPSNTPVVKAQVLRAMQCLTDARAVLRAHLLRHPDDAKAYQILFEVLRALGDFDSARFCLNRLPGKDRATAELKLSLASGDLSDALLKSEAAVTQWPEDAAILTMYCDVLSQRLDVKAAAQVLDARLAAAPQDHVLLVRRAQLALEAKDTDLAAKLLDRSLPTLQALQLHQKLDDLQGSGRARSTARIDKRLAQHLASEQDGAMSCRDHMDMGDLLFLKGDWRGALRRYQLSEADSGENRSRTLKVARCHHRLLDFRSCRKALDRVLEKAPDWADALILRSGIDLIEGRVADSMDALKQLFGGHDARRVSHGVRLFRAYMRCGDPAAAEQVKSELVLTGADRFEPELIDCLLQFNSAETAFDLSAPWAQAALDNNVHLDLFQSVEAASKRSFGLNWPVSPDLSLPSADPARDFEDMAALGARRVKEFTDPVVPLSIKAAWSVTEHSDMGFDAWQAVARQSTQNIRRLSCLAPRRQDIADFTEFPERSVLGKYAFSDEPLILMSSHVGPAVSCALDDTLLAGRKIAYLRTQPDHDRQKDRIIVVGNDPQAAAQALVKAVGDGHTVGLAVDSPTLWQSGGRTSRGANGLLFGIPVTVSATPLKLAQAFKRPMLWLQPLWQNGKIVFQVEEMAVPDKTVPFQEAADIWAADYLTRVEKVMRSGPENQDLSAPMWQHLVYHGLGRKTL